ncbi:ATP synthase F0 subunit A [Bacteroidetes/Chlorobi group bacterium Naka2016]|jgi:F-type H+-transporting ATPase subunit a|nr:MAG: ATP synthase F0 subunit A [Bacteroidetes/Chlorobi group bacterium Naka2016]
MGNENIVVASTETHTNDAVHGSHTGDIPPSQVFPTLLGTLGEHRELTFFHYHIVDLPVILYDKENGLDFYANIEKMQEAGKYTLSTTHKIVKTNKPNESPTLDLSVTSLVCFQWLAMLILLVAFFRAGRRAKKNPISAPKGIQNLLETIIVFLRDDVVVPNIPDKKVAYKLLPYFVSLFVFILLMNLFGLIPGGHTATGALGTTAGLAITALFVINGTAIRQIGLKNWLKHLLGGAPWYLFFIMVPIEIISIFTKPFALTVRLFANMTAGHVVLLSLVGLIFYLKTLAMAVVAVPFSIFMYALELLVAFLQAFIFTILTAVFTGLAIGEHSEHAEHH